mmetsp:Transcript_1812/g.1889  ORF Transcript_1812/g.1889 Transcript_1812/m.1889 type:complete len:141 (+) Transcript_1812:93-515(+)
MFALKKITYFLSFLLVTDALVPILPRMRMVVKLQTTQTNSHLTEPTSEISLTCRGQVQGPFFRTTTKNEILFNRKLTGYLTEKEGGVTEIVVQGEKSKLESFIRWCKKGPGLGQIVIVEDVKWSEIKQPQTGFQMSVLSD